MSKYNLESVVTEVQKLYNKTPNELNNIALGDGLKTLAPENFIHMPKWWQDATNTLGLPFGACVMIAGDSDSGKTSAAIEAMKSAQQQEVAVIYVETENKTTKEDLDAAGVDTKGIIVIKETIAEKAFKKLFETWDAFFKKYPDGKVLVVFDSIGNVISLHDLELDLETSSQKPGGKGKTNRLGINKLIGKGRSAKVALLVLNYVYDNIGSPGKTNAGGKALNFFSSLTYQTSRKQWLEKTVKGVKMRIGARVQWKLFKNHLDKAHPGPKTIELDITANGITLVDSSND